MITLETIAPMQATPLGRYLSLLMPVYRPAPPPKYSGTLKDQVLKFIRENGRVTVGHVYARFPTVKHTSIAATLNRIKQETVLGIEQVGRGVYQVRGYGL